MFGALTVATVAWRVFEAWSTLEFISEKSGLFWSAIRFLFASEMGANVLVVGFVALFVGSLLFQFERTPLNPSNSEVLATGSPLELPPVTATTPEAEPEPNLT